MIRTESTQQSQLVSLANNKRNKVIAKEQRKYPEDKAAFKARYDRFINKCGRYYALAYD